MRPQDYAYDVVAGVSIGAMNGATLSLYEKGDEKAAVDKLLEVWHNIETEKVWESWGYFIIAGLWQPSFLNSKPLHDMVE